MFEDYWWSDNSIGLVKINDELYALDGWNGEKYLHCWKCVDKFTFADEDTEYEVIPVYEENDDGDFEIVSYKLI